MCSNSRKGAHVVVSPQKVWRFPVSVWLITRFYLHSFSGWASLFHQKQNDTRKKERIKKTVPVRPFVNINTPRGNHSEYLNTQTGIIASAACRKDRRTGRAASQTTAGRREAEHGKRERLWGELTPTASTTEERNPRTKESPGRLATVWTRVGFHQQMNSPVQSREQAAHATRIDAATLARRF